MANIIMNKGGFGIAFSRQETGERTNRLLRKQVELREAYSVLANSLSDTTQKEKLEKHQRALRISTGKLSEVVLSNGQAPYTGADLDPQDLKLGQQGSVLDDVVRLEREFSESLQAELKENFPIHTQAVLGNVLRESRERLDFITTLSR